MKIIVIGIGKVGYTVAEQLIMENHDVTLVDTSRDALRDALGSLDAIGIHGNGASSAILLEAGVADSGLVIALTGSDELNLLCCLVAKRLGAKGTIARVRNPEYHKDLDMVSDSLGLTMAINPEHEAALEIFRILKFPTAINVDIFSKGMIDLVSFEVCSGCVLCDKPVKQSFSNIGYNVLACAVHRHDGVYIPNGDFVIREGDVVAAMIPPHEIQDFFKSVGIPVKRVKNAMIIGGGVIAQYLVKELLNLNINITIIEKDREIAKNLSFLFPSVNVVCADGTNREVLLEEGLHNTDAVCSLTGFDEENIFLSLYAKNIESDIKTVTKVNKIAFQELTGILDIGSVVYPKYITANKILQHVRARQNNVGSNVETLYKIIDNKVEALEFHVAEDSLAANRTLIEMTLKPDVLIGAITRDGKPFIPHGNDRLLPGDSVVVVTTMTGLSDLDSIIEEKTYE
jgi:trk system potassium uptake protein TrkA